MVNYHAQAAPIRLASEEYSASLRARLWSAGFGFSEFARETSSPMRSSCLTVNSVGSVKSLFAMAVHHLK